MWIVEDKIEIYDLVCWRFFCFCEDEELADRIMAEFNYPMRKREVEIIKDLEQIKKLKLK